MNINKLLLFLAVFFFSCLLSPIMAQDAKTPPCNFGDCPPIYLFRACADGSPGYKCVIQDNQCVAQATDCPVSATPCGQNSDCNDNQFCSKMTCQNATGECRYVSDVCTAIYAPVCGCDGKTYASTCEAQRARVNVQYDGTCDGATCTATSECRSTSYCSKSSGCDGEGSCTPRPEVCFDLFNPVCGCDGQTYPNQCYAQRSGSEVQQTGACPNKTTTECKFTECTPLETFRACADGSPGYICVRNSTGTCVAQATDCPAYCTSSSECGDGAFCNKPSCDAKEGKCVTYAAIRCSSEYIPVCGCDGKTYPNGCGALVAQQSVNYTGECAATTTGGSTTNTCTSNSDCADGSFCSKPTCRSPTGQCERYVGFLCTLIYDPVCGCDGKTYGSACNARTNKQNVAYTGECKTDVKVCFDNSECGKGSYCQKPTCRAVSGKCASLVNPSCSGTSGPVCGCNNVQYASPCEAAQTGVNINVGNKACSPRSKRSRR